MTTVQMPTKELRGEALDYAVAMAIGKEVQIKPFRALDSNRESITVMGCVIEGRTDSTVTPAKRGLITWRPSTAWAQGGPLLEQYKIEIISHGEGQWASVEEWCYGEVMSCYATSPTYLTAGMRAIVELKLGKTVDIPEELAQ